MIDAQRFWSHVKIGNASECWPWTAATNEKGYGVVGTGDGKTTKAHRVAWFLKTGRFSSKICVLHQCDNPPCCNPDHLFEGSRADNNRDMHAKGRGVIHNVAGWNRKILSEEIVSQFGKVPDHKLAVVAGVNKSVIQRARTARGIKSFAERNGNPSQFKAGNYPARWL